MFGATRDRYLKVNIAAVIIGILAGYGAILFRGMIGFLQNLLYHNKIGFELVSPMENRWGIWVIAIIPIGLIIASYLVKWFAQEAKGSGIPEVIEAVLVKTGIMRKRIVLVKAIASSITIAFGGSVGREGPIVQIGSSVGSTLGRIFNISGRDLVTLVGCGAAAAIAATFNTPIGGIIFALELILLEFRSKSFIPLVIAAVFAALVSRYHLGNSPSFSVPEYTLSHPVELLCYLGLGILAGLVGVLMIYVLYGLEDFTEKVCKIPFLLKPIIGGVLLGAMAYFFPELLGVGYDTIDSILHQQSSLWLMVGLIFLKIIASSLTIVSGGSGGVFAPSLFVGAALGGVYGVVVNKFFPGVTAGYGAYALVGMAAVFASSSRATFTAIVIIFEMTLDYSIILPLMFTCVVADLVSIELSKDATIFSMRLKKKGISFIEGFGVSSYDLTPVKNIMNTKVRALYSDMTLGEAVKVIEHSSHNVFPVITREGILVGITTAGRILKKQKDHGKNSLIRKYIKEKPSTVYPNTTIANCVKKFKRSRDPRIVVIEGRNRKMVGIISPSDIVQLMA